MAKFDKVYQPIKIGNVELKNRICMAPMDTELVDNFHITETIIDFYEQRAKGGTALVEVGSCYVCDLFGTKPSYYNTSGAAGLWDDCFKDGWVELVNRVHKWGAKIAPQLQICYEWRANGDDPLEAVGPSDGPGGPFVKKLRELKVEEIETMVKQYAAAAKRAKDWGCDMIEIHAGIGYQVSRFISKFSNRRTDRYGGSDEKRCQFLIDIVNAIRAEVGEDFPIIIRISVEDFMPGGNKMENSIPQIRHIENSCHVDAWSIQVGFHEAPTPLVVQWVPEASYTDLSRQVKEITNLPVFASSNLINSMEQVAEVIDKGQGDIVALARQSIADPEFAIKGQDDHPERIRRCITCCRCLDNIFLGKPVQCSVNANVAAPDLGTPPTYKDGIAQVAHPLNIVIAGAGASGMECARVAAMRGHKITMIEHNSRIGGLLNMAQVLNYKLERTVNWYANEIKLLPIEVKLKTEATVDSIKDLNPDKVVIAPGGNVPVPDCPGVNGKNVMASTDIKALVEGKAPKGKGAMYSLSALGVKIIGAKPNFLRFGLATHLIVKKRLAVIGGGFAGLEVAHSMMEGREVTVIESARKVGAEVGIIDKGPEMNLLKAGGVKMITNARVLEIVPSGVRIYRKDLDIEDFVPCETVILSLGVEDNTELYDACVKEFGEDKVQIIGNGKAKSKQENPDECRRLLEAVRDGYRAGMTL